MKLSDVEVLRKYSDEYKRAKETLEKLNQRLMSITLTTKPWQEFNGEVNYTVDHRSPDAGEFYAEIKAAIDRRLQLIQTKLQMLGVDDFKG